MVYYFNLGLQNVNLNVDPKKIEEEAKQILILEIKNQVETKLREEMKRNKQMEEKLKNYKNEFANQNEKLQNFLTSKDKKVSDAKNSINMVDSETQKNQMELSKANDRMLGASSFESFINIEKPQVLKIIAVEATIEEMLAVIRRALEKNILTFDETVRAVRTLTREILKVRFYRDKVIQRKKYY